MKKLSYLVVLCCMAVGTYTSTAELDPATVLADTLYAAKDYTVPSYTEFLVAKKAAKEDASQANLQALVDKVAALKSKDEPYCMVSTINGDPATRMGFCWFTNDSVFDGAVQVIAKADATAEDFEGSNGVLAIEATTTRTKQLRYGGICGYIVEAAGIAKTDKYRYISHKALADNLKPGTEYSWRVGYTGHWSEIGHFRTMDAEQGEFSFIYMTDSHIMNPEYIRSARRCAEVAAKTVPEARFCVFPGDFVEDGDGVNSEWEWERWFEESLKPVILQMPIVPTDGNHDASPNLNYTHHFNTDNSFNKVYKKPQFDGIIYSFVYGDALFLVFSMQDYWRDDYNLDVFSSAYLNGHIDPWFREQVIAHPDTKYRISLAHFNLFSGSDHSTDQEPPLFRATMLPAMKDCEIDVALQGHDHTYEVIGPVNPDDCTPILSAISGREEVAVDVNKNRTGYKGGTYCTDDGTLYFIGATCGHKRYYPHSRERMENEYTDDPATLKDGKHHNVKNYFDLFTGMFGQPEAPSFTKVTVKADCLEFNSYTANVIEGTATLFNTMRVVRNKAHGVPERREGLEMPAVWIEGEKIFQNGNIYIRHNGRMYTIFGQIL